MLKNAKSAEGSVLTKLPRLRQVISGHRAVAGHELSDGNVRQLVAAQRRQIDRVGERIRHAVGVAEVNLAIDLSGVGIDINDGVNVPLENFAAGCARCRDDGSKHYAKLHRDCIEILGGVGVQRQHHMRQIRVGSVKFGDPLRQVAVSARYATESEM